LSPGTVTTLTYADEAAIRLAVGTAITDAEVHGRFTVARDAALAFRDWMIALFETYIDVSGGEIGEPVVSRKPGPSG
jgi:hypothetical protein